MLTEKKFLFYHADRGNSLSEGQTIELDTSGLSRFGATYWNNIENLGIEEMNSAQLREYYLEMIRREPKYQLYASRMQSLFAANSIWEAIAFAEWITPRPETPIRIFEIYADRFWTLDSNWLDYDGDLNRSIECYRNYWEGRITNHRPMQGERRPPALEVMIPLPATVGKVVKVV